MASRSDAHDRGYEAGERATQFRNEVRFARNFEDASVIGPGSDRSCWWDNPLHDELKLSTCRIP